MFNALISSRFIFLIVCSRFLLMAQNPSRYALRQVIELAQEMIGKGDFAGASPMLDELKFALRMRKIQRLRKFFNNLVLFEGLVIYKVCKSGKKNLLLRQRVPLVSLRRKFPNDPKANGHAKENGLSSISYKNGKKQLSVIETLLDTNQPYRKQILKRSDLLNLYYGKAQCYHIEQRLGKKENQHLRELLKFADAAKDEDRAHMQFLA